VRVLRISHSAVVDAWRERERALRRRGVDVHLLSARRWDEGGQTVELRPTPGEQVTGIGTVGRHPALFLYDPVALWRALGRDWDVIDIHEEPFALATAEVLVLRALRGNRARYVLYSAQNIDKRYPPPFRWLERWALRSASQLSVCNSEAGRIAVRKGFSGRPRTIPLGVDVARAEPVEPPVRDAAAVRVGYVGRLAPHKGVAVLLDAVAGDPRLVLRLAGGGPSEAELRSRVVELGIGGRVEFTGFLDQAALPAFYRGLDVLAVPSVPTPGWLEQFGRVAVEAMACGVPVVASDTGALPDVVGGAGVLVPPGDAAALRDALVTVGTDRALAAGLRVAGLARARSCSWESVADEYVALYRRAAAAPAPAPDRPLEVVVVAYGSPELLREAIAPLSASFPVTVVDNSSLPQIRELCDETGVRYVDPGYNGGFAAGVNAGLGARVLPGSDVLLLNPDAVVTPEAVRELHRALLADPTLASVGPLQVDGAGAPTRVGWPFPSPLATWLEAVGLGRLRDRRADFVIGSVLLLRAEALDHVGGLDEQFFLYAEETDWAFRAARLGWRHAVVPTATATHLGGATSTDRRRRETHFHASQERYLRKHYGSVGWQLARAGQLAGSGARALLIRDGRGAAARARLGLYAHGPVRAEARIAGRPQPVRAEAS
jgi:glycosyltransferase involved in cell wall biosynthesis/GT2 family glycosyltransferase